VTASPINNNALEVQQYRVTGKEFWDFTLIPYVGKFKICNQEYVESLQVLCSPFPNTSVAVIVDAHY
jgi:hypothetical protein